MIDDLYKVRFEQGGYTISEAKMNYVAHPGNYVVLKVNGNHVRYQITAITWTPGLRGKCHYVLSVDYPEQVSEQVYAA